tara:strand:+ start:104 stop:289 length:186 start_codon:yes stop_codon:yes gene_type:complete
MQMVKEEMETHLQSVQHKALMVEGQVIQVLIMEPLAVVEHLQQGKHMLVLLVMMAVLVEQE